MTLALVRYEPPPTRKLQMRLITLGKLEDELQRLEEQYEKVYAEQREFQKRYKPAVGERHHQLEELREKIRLAWGEIRKARSGDLVDYSKAEQPEEAAHEAFRPEVELRKLFRELARRIHPDFADSYEESRRRHEFMAEASRAYRAKDAMRLQWLLEHWEAMEEMLPDSDPDNRLARTNQRIAWVRYRVQELHQLIAALSSSPLAEIMQEAEEARRRGRNFIVELRNRIIDEIKEAEADLQKVQEALAEFDGETVRIIRANAALD